MGGGVTDSWTEVTSDSDPWTWKWLIFGALVWLALSLVCALALKAAADLRNQRAKHATEGTSLVFPSKRSLRMELDRE